MDKDTNNWAPWEPAIGNPQEGLDMIRTVMELRRGPGKVYLVFGRMLRPATVNDIPLIAWSWKGRKNNTPAIFHSAWQAPDGQTGLVLANWTSRRRRISVCDVRLTATGKENVWVTIASPSKPLEKKRSRLVNGALRITIPAHGCILVEAAHE